MEFQLSTEKEMFLLLPVLAFRTDLLEKDPDIKGAKIYIGWGFWMVYIIW
jgi:hypothetical protein